MDVRRLKTYWFYWLKSSELTLQSLLATRLASVMFIIGKFIRFFFFLWFLLILDKRLQTIAGYTFDQLVIFFLIYNLFDVIGQLFYRGIYWFRDEVISGDFDFKLVKPLSPLFQLLTKRTDFLDLPLLITVIIFLIIKLPTIPSLNILAFAFVSFNALIIITAVHIAVASIGIITTEVDHTMWIFRDLASMARMPINIYVEFIRAFLTYIIPIALIFTLPAQALLNLLSPLTVIISLAVALFIYYLSLKFWRYALTKYSSASS